MGALTTRGAGAVGIGVGGCTNTSTGSMVILVGVFWGGSGCTCVEKHMPLKCQA